MKVAEEWRRALKSEGYEHHISKASECRRLGKPSRIWRRIFSLIKLNPDSGRGRVFEVGCGGARHLAFFAVCGWHCVGIDSSPEVLRRAEDYIKDIRRVCGKNIEVEFIAGDFLEYSPTSRGLYDLVFHVGVLEHFLNDRERLTAVKKMFEITKPGGFVVSIVPSGTHPLRQKMKDLKLGGYGIPEIDYTPALMEDELRACGAEDIKIAPHNIFGYLLIINRRGVLRMAMKIFYYLFQIIPPQVLPYKFSVRQASTLIAVARKPL